MCFSVGEWSRKYVYLCEHVVQLVVVIHACICICEFPLLCMHLMYFFLSLVCETNIGCHRDVCGRTLSRMWGRAREWG